MSSELALAPGMSLLAPAPSAFPVGGVLAPLCGPIPSLQFPQFPLEDSLAVATGTASPHASPVPSGSLPDLQRSSLPFSHRWQLLFGQNMSVFTLGERDFLIGVQIAVLLKRETFNLYRSIKIKGIELVRAENEHVDFLVNCNSIKRGTHSVTLIPLDEGIAFVDEERRRQGKAPRKTKSKKLDPGFMKRSRTEEDDEEEGQGKLLRLSLSGSDEDLRKRSSALIPPPPSSSSSSLSLLEPPSPTSSLSPAASPSHDDSPLPWHMLLLAAREVTQGDA